MARETQHPDRRGKGMDMDDTRTRRECPDCGGLVPPRDNHADDCPNAPD